jgi:hypothetical protein
MPNLVLGMEFWLILRFLKSMIFDDFVDFVDFMDGCRLLVFENLENLPK